MNNIKTKFSIKDLEKLSGIKAHTIRIWEKRYSLFQPNRTDTNIRNYSLKSLQKILNISYLNRNGYKISKIAKLSEKEIPLLVNEISKNKNQNNSVLNAFKMAMFSFDKSLFYSTYSDLEKQYSFKDIFYLFIVPFLDDIGLLWQTDTITPAHEHFIVELIKQKILVITENEINIEKNKNSNQTYVLFLPENEIHELGLLFINYELTRVGAQSIYLGQSVPIESLEYLTDFYNDITFISNFTVKPDTENINNYLETLSNKVLTGTNNNLLISGRQIDTLDTSELNEKISLFKSTKAILETLTPNKNY